MVSALVLVVVSISLGESSCIRVMKKKKRFASEIAKLSAVVTTGHEVDKHEATDDLVSEIAQLSAVAVGKAGEPVDHRITAHEQEATDDASADPVLQVMAISYNAGNTKFRNRAHAQNLAMTLTLGHEGADIVAMGFQEYNDKFRQERPCAGPFSLCSKAPVDDRPTLSDFIIEEHLWNSTNGTRHHFQSVLDLPNRWHCHNTPKTPVTEPHYDTSLHVFVKDGSWIVERYAIYGTKLGERSVECGKGATFIKLRMRHHPEYRVLDICFINAHLSFKDAPTDRISAIKKIMDIASGFRCQSTIFVGDFNTRLNCKESDFDGEPLIEQDVQSTFFQLAALMHKPYDPPHSWYLGFDELSLALHAPAFKCKSKNGWEDTGGTNTLQEAAPVTFPPTYKFSNADQVSGPLFAGCNEEGRCLNNKDQDWKHNPAWTDRILLGPLAEGVRINTKSYDSRNLVPGEFAGSDHNMVVATMQITVSIANASSEESFNLEDMSGPYTDSPFSTYGVGRQV